MSQNRGIVALTFLSCEEGREVGGERERKRAVRVGFDYGGLLVALWEGWD